MGKFVNGRFRPDREKVALADHAERPKRPKPKPACKPTRLKGVCPTCGLEGK